MAPVAGRDPVRDLWVPLRRPEDVGPRARAAQLLEMLISYQLIGYAWLEGSGFLVEDQGKRHMEPEEVVERYGDRVATMVERVMEDSEKTTTRTSVPVGRAEGAVPYIADVTDRVTEYGRYW